jgi:hypothetical protein
MLARVWLRKPKSMPYLKLLTATKLHRSYCNPSITAAVFPPLFPGQGYGVPVKLPTKDDGSQEMLTEAQITSLNQGKTYAAVFGWISYSDQFGPHWTRFCLWKDYVDNVEDAESAKFSSRSCVLWNSVGDGYPPKDAY